MRHNINYAEYFEEKVTALTKYVSDYNIEALILGISGGIDSTVVAALLYEVRKKIHRENPDYIFGNFGCFRRINKFWSVGVCNTKSNNYTMNMGFYACFAIPSECLICKIYVYTSFK